MEGIRFEHFHNAATENPAAAATAPFERGLICSDCGLICHLFTSNSVKNPRRKYYKCLPHNSSFRWADTVKPHEFIEVPYCGGCSAGLCRVKKQKHGPNAGRIMLLCRVKEGQGSCGYRKWLDELIEEGQAEERMNLLKTSSTVIDMVKDIQQRDERTDPVSPLFESSDHLLCPGVASQTMNQEITARKLDRLTCPESKTSITSRKPLKRSRCGDIPAVSYPLESTFMVQDISVNSNGSITPVRDCKGVESYTNLSFNLEHHHNPLDSTYALHEEISSTMDSHFHIEVEASCCEHEMKNLELQLEKISKKKEELEGKYLIAFEELEESLKLFEQKEAECNAAKAAFNRARALLRGENCT